MTIFPFFLFFFFFVLQESCAVQRARAVQMTMGVDEHVRALCADTPCIWHCRCLLSGDGADEKRIFVSSWRLPRGADARQSMET
jgi:hypothetical protein